MFAAVLLALATTAAYAAPLAQRDAAPKGWAKGYLENYDACKSTSPLISHDPC